MSTNYRRILVIGGLFVSYIFYELSLVLLVAFVSCVVLCLVYFAPSAQGYSRTLGLNYSPTSTVGVTNPSRMRASTLTQNTNIKHGCPTENVIHNELVLSTPWGLTTSSAALRRRVVAGKPMDSCSVNRVSSRIQPLNQTASASMLHRPPTTTRTSGGLSTQILSAAFSSVRQHRCGSLGSFPTVNLDPQPLPFLRERNTNMIHSAVTIKVGPPTLSPVRVDYTYSSKVKSSPGIEAVVANLGTRKRTCTSSTAENTNEYSKRQRREEIVTSHTDFTVMHPAPSVLNGMLRSTANILMQQSACANSQKRRFDSSLENLSVKRNRNNEISSSYSSSKRLATQKKKCRASRSSSPSIQINKDKSTKSDESFVEEQSSTQGSLSSPISKLLATSSPCCSNDTSSLLQSGTSESSPLPVSEKLSSFPITPWAEGFSRKRQLPVYASVSTSNISKPLYIPEGSTSVDDEKRDQLANQVRLNKLLSSVRMAFNSKTEKQKLQRTPDQEILSPGMIKSPEVPSPLSHGSTGFTTSTPVTSGQASLPAATASLTATPTLSLSAVSSTSGILSIVSPAATTAAPNVSLPAPGVIVSCSNNTTQTSTQLVSPSLNFGFTSTSTASLPVINSVPKSSGSVVPFTISMSAVTVSTCGVKTTLPVPSLSNTASNVSQVTATSDLLPPGGLASSANILTSAPSSVALSLFNPADSATTEEKPSAFQLTTPTNLLQFRSASSSNAAAAEPSSNPPPYSTSGSTSATTSMGVTSGTFPTFAFAAISASSLPSSQLPSASVTVTTTTTAAAMPQFGFTAASSVTTTPSFALNSPLTSSQKQQELGVPGLITASSANPFTTSTFGVPIVTGDKTNGFSFPNTTAVATVVPTLQFGNASANLANSTSIAANATLLSSFGSSSTLTTTPSVVAFNKPSIPATSFFQVSSTAGQTTTQPKLIVQFGGSAGTNTDTPQFQFGQNVAANTLATSNITSMSQSMPVLTFGQNPVNTSAANPLVQFGQTPSTSQVNSAVKPAPAASLFQFGPTNATLGSSSAPSNMSFKFGNANAGFGIGGNTEVSGGISSGFTFALPSSSFQPTVTSSFFTQQNAAGDPNPFGTTIAPSYGFGSETTSQTILSNGSNPSHSRGVSSVFQFGTGVSGGQAAAAVNPSTGFNFVAQPQQTNAGGFNFSMGTPSDINFGGGNRNTVSGSTTSTRRATQARRRINR